MTGTTFLIFSIISLASALVSLVVSLAARRRGRSARRILSPMQLFTIGIFIAIFIAFLPIYFTHYSFGDGHLYLRPVLLAFHNSLRTFILDGDFDIIVNATLGLHQALRIAYCVYMAVLYVVAPILTFSNILSLFENIKGELAYRFRRSAPCYILSELNAKSLALARNIRQRSIDEGTNAIIVFADVYEDSEEEDYELIIEARDINAICLRKDASHLNIISRTGPVELFLIGEDESENVSQALRITNELDSRNKKHNVKIFVFSQSASSAYIIDSARYDNLLAHAGENDYDDSTFKLRRVNEVQQLVWKTVPQMKVYDIADRHDKRLSVLLVGFGKYGFEFFKTLVWYCQFEGYTLEINIIDSKLGNGMFKSCAESTINRHCPELLEKNRCTVDGESHYDIEIYPGVDVSRNDLSELVFYSGDDPERIAASERLRRTNLAIVALGNDDLNIEVSVYLRSLFDRVCGTKASKKTTAADEPVEIYSVVYDDQKSGILHGSDDAGFLVNHKSVPYHINFIGALSERFEYDNIYDRKLEAMAYHQHSGWTEIDERIHKEWLAAGKTEDLAGVDCWYYEFENTKEAKAAARQQYEKYEYYRLSSMAKELAVMERASSKTLSEAIRCTQEGLQTCECENCIRRKKSEHMRWNAYTRVVGYSFSKTGRADRAKLHDDLRPWHELSNLEKQKD